MQEKESIRLCVSKMDAQRREHIDILLMQDPRVEEVRPSEEPDYWICDNYSLFNPQTIKLPRASRVIVLQPNDLYNAMIGLRWEDHDLRNYARAYDLEFIFMCCETDPMDCRANPWQRKPIQPDGHIVLTLPMGYFAGSKLNITYQDNDTSVFFRNTMRGIQNGPYNYNWCFIGTETCQDRTDVKEILEGRKDKGFAAFNPIVTETDIQKRMHLIHADNKPVPYREFLEISRQSKINLSLNGLGMWCYKDCEMLANGCFVLRQYHPSLEMNPFSPKDFLHWVVFKNHELNDVLDYYLNHPEERDEIRQTGYEYFKAAINGGWAKFYVDALIEYKNTGKRKVFGGLLFN